MTAPDASVGVTAQGSASASNPLTAIISNLFSPANLGPSELAHYLVILGGVLVSFFGKDWGLTAHAQNLAPVLVTIATVSLGLFRSIKHHAHAKVAVAQIAADTASAALAASVAAAAPKAKATAKVAVAASGDAAP